MKERFEDRLADFTRDSRIIVLSLLAIVVGVLGALYPAVWAANLWPLQALRRR